MDYLLHCMCEHRDMGGELRGMPSMPHDYNPDHKFKKIK